MKRLKPRPSAPPSNGVTNDVGSAKLSRVGAKPTKCTWCGLKFSRSIGLIVHQRACVMRPSTSDAVPARGQTTNPSSSNTPTLRDQFPCDHCPSKYATRRGLSTHKNKAHRADWDAEKRDRFLADGPRQHHWLESDLEILCMGEEEYQTLPPTARMARYFNFRNGYRWCRTRGGQLCQCLA